MAGKAKGQSSLEALFSFALLLSVLAILLLSAKRQAEGFSDSVQLSRERQLLAYDALSLDTAAFSLQPAVLHENESGFSVSANHSIRSERRAIASQFVFHEVSRGPGGYFNVGRLPAEPV